MDLKKGDLVVCYVTNTHEWETLMCWGIVLEVNETLEDVRVLDNEGNTRWCHVEDRKILSEKKSKISDI